MVADVKNDYINPIEYAQRVNMLWYAALIALPRVLSSLTWRLVEVARGRCLRVRVVDDARVWHLVDHHPPYSPPRVSLLLVRLLHPSSASPRLFSSL